MITSYNNRRAVAATGHGGDATIRGGAEGPSRELAERAMSLAHQPCLAPAWRTLLVPLWLLTSAALGRAGDGISALNTGLNVINTTINVVDFAQQIIDQQRQAKAQAEIVLAEYWHRRTEGYWEDGKQVATRRLTYMYRRPSFGGAPMARWVVRDGKGRILERGTNVLHARIALRDTHCTNAPNAGIWSADQEGYLLGGMAKVLSAAGHTIHNPEIMTKSFEATVTGLRHLLDPTNACGGEILTESLLPKRLALRFDQPVYFRLESTNTVEFRRANGSNVIAVVPRCVQNRIYDLPGTLMAGWNSRLSNPSPEEAQRLLARAQTVGRAPGALRDKATRAVLALVSATYRDGIPEVQRMPPPIRSGDGAWDLHRENPDHFGSE